MVLYAFSIGLLSLLTLSSAQSTPNNNSSLVANVTAAFNQSQIVPDVISTFKPAALLDVFFNNSASNQSVHVLPGAHLPSNQTRAAPQYSLTFNRTITSSNTSWVITIVDPDAPSRRDPSLAQFLHFMGQDFKISPTTGAANNTVTLTNSSAAVVEFFPPTPPPGSGPHRYVVLAWVQPANFTTVARTLLNITDPANITRQNFDIETFAKNASLRNPIAGTFFFVEEQNITAPNPSAPATVPPPQATLTTPISTVALLPSMPVPSGSAPASSTQPNTAGAAKIVNGWSTVALIVLSIVGGYLA